MSSKLAREVNTIQNTNDDQKLMFFMDERFELMAKACIGDMQLAESVMQQAFQLLADFQDDSPTDAMTPMNCMLMSFFLLAASIPDLDTKNVQRFILDRFKMMWPCAQSIVEQHLEQMEAMGKTISSH